MKKLLTLTIFMVPILFSNVQANACTVEPLNQVMVKNQLAAEALTHQNISIENLTYIAFENYKGDYIWTPMCPKGYSAEATLNLSYNDPSDPLSKGCTAVIKVTKEHLYEQSQHENQAKIEVIQGGICLE